MNKQGEERCKIVAIFGMGGVGKTTLAKELFNRKRSDYNRSCFLFDVREASVKKQLPSLQIKILRELFNENIDQIFPSLEDGTSCLSNHFARSGDSSFLIVVDDIDHLEQLDALQINLLKASGNSLVIVTTRDVGVLINAGITVAYNLKGMDTDDAKELFCLHAFGQSNPSSGYEDLVNLFVDLCGGSPLSLQVLGSHVHGTDQKFWELELKKVEKTLPQDILKRLRISIDTLDHEEKQIFMDVACFFIGEVTKYAIRVWEGVWEASGWSGQHALRRLKNKCLVEEIENSRQEKFELRMHDHLRDLGREMADELSHPRRLWRPQDLKSLDAKGFENILSQPKIRCLHSFRNPSTGCHVKYFIGESNNMTDTSTRLLWLELDLRHLTLTNIPPWIPLQIVRSLSIGSGGLKRLLQNNEQTRFTLKEVRIRSISDLKETSLDLLRCLKNFTISSFYHPESVTGMTNLTKLVELNITSVTELKDLNLVQFSCVEKIRISNCPFLKRTLELTDLRKLKEIQIVNCGNLEELTLVQLSCLEKIRISDCPELKNMAGISDLRKLVELKINDCGNLEELSHVQNSCLETNTNFRSLNLHTVTVPHLEMLRELNISGCAKIEELILVQLSCLGKLRISDCPVLKYVAGISELRELVELNINGCDELQEISLVRLNRLKTITISFCLKLQSLTLSHLGNLVELNIIKYVNINELSLVELNYLKSITFPSVKSIEVRGCNDLRRVDLENLKNVENLIICDCPELQFDELCFARVSRLKTIVIDNCGKMQKTAGIEKLCSLERMHVVYCNNETIRNCILKMEKLPSEFIQVIARAADGAASTLDESFFCAENINANSVIQISTDTICPDDLVSAIILCAVVVINTSTAANLINDFNGGRDCNPWLKFKLRQGEWLITSVITDPDEIHKYILNKGYYFPFDYVFTDRTITEEVTVKKGYKVTVPGKKGEEHKALNLLLRIVAKLY